MRRTKTGWGTSRERKKKCDEARPECRNNELGSLSCEGYVNAKLLPMISFLIGGLLGNIFDIVAPFRIAFVSFMMSCVIVAMALPATPRREELHDVRRHSGVRIWQRRQQAAAVLGK
jgi:hypothetical protein